MSVGGDNRPFREKYPLYASCWLGAPAQHYRPSPLLVKKNTTTRNPPAVATDKPDGSTAATWADLSNWNSDGEGFVSYNCADGAHYPTNFSHCPTDPNTGKSTLPSTPISYFTICLECQGGGIAYPLNRNSNGTLNTYWDNTFANCDALDVVTVTAGGTLYHDGDLMVCPATCYPQMGQQATFRIKATPIVSGSGGVIQSVTKVTDGIYAGIGANALAAATTALPYVGGYVITDGSRGTGAAFTFTRKDAMFDGGKCNQFGHAEAGAFRQWHGTFGFLSPSCLGCAGDGYTADGSKFTKITLSECMGVISDGGDAPFDASIFSGQPVYDDIAVFLSGFYNAPYGDFNFYVGSNTVDKQKGVLEFGIENTAYGSFDTADGFIPQIDSGVNPDTGHFVGDDTAYPPVLVFCPGSGPVENPMADPDQTDPNTYIFEQSSSQDNNTGDTTIYTSDIFDLNTYPTPDSGDLFNVNQDKLYFRRTNTHYEWILMSCFVFLYPPYGVLPKRWQGPFELYFSCGTIDLGDVDGDTAGTYENTSNDVISDLEGSGGLLETWSLIDPILMPPTTNAFDGIMVKVTRNEVPGDVSPAQYQPYYVTDGTEFGYKLNIDPNAAKYDGSIKGAPLDKTVGGGYPLDYFDPEWQKWELYACCPNKQPNPCSDGSQPAWEVDGFGDWRSNHANLPPRATQWTNTFDTLILTTGRQRISGAKPTVNPLSGIWATKWMETAVRLPSYNHARPFGTDRCHIDGTANTKACIDSDGFNGFTFGIVSGSLSALTGGDTLIIFGTDFDGLYSFVSNVAGVYTVTYVAALPSYQKIPVSDNCGGNGVVYRVAYKNVPPMAGRLAVVSVTDNGDGTVTVEHAAMPIKNQVETNNVLYNVNLTAKDMTPLLTNITPTAVPATSHFTATMTYATVKDAKWLTLYGALTGDSGPAEVAHWYWNDDKGKGNFWIGQWDKINGVYQDCIATEYNKAFDARCPYKIVLSPNASDTPTYGARYDFSESRSFTADETCGRESWLDVMQAMQDPMYVPPWRCPVSPMTVYDCHLPCVPLVEARLTLPGATTTPPDNGAGAAQNEAAPSGGNFIDYHVNLDAAHEGANPPNSTSQPVVVYAPTGIFNCP